MDNKRRGYWPTVFSEARQLSSDYFAWKIPSITFGAVSLFIALAQGEKKAAEYVAAAIGGAVAAVSVAVIAYAVNVVRASSRVYMRELARADALAGQCADLEKRWTAENTGLKVQLGAIECYYDEPDLDGVMVAIIVNRIINGNANNACIQITLKAPIAISGVRVVMGTNAHHVAVPYVDYNVPLLPPLINIPAKHGMGPGYLLFHLERSHLTGFPFIRPRTNPTNDELGKMVWDSEMYFEVYDLLNPSSGALETIDAPGTMQKRYNRVVADVKREEVQEAAQTLNQHQTKESRAD